MADARTYRLLVVAKRAAVRLCGPGLGARLGKALAWTISGAVSSSGATLLANVIVARHLGRAGYGGFAVIQSTIVMAGVFAGLGIGLTSRKFVAEFRATDHARAGRVIAICMLAATCGGGLAAAVVAAAAGPLAAEVLGSAELAGPLRWAGLLLLLNTIIGAQAGIITGFEGFRANALRGFAASLITLPSVAVGVRYGGLGGAILGLAGGAAVNLGLYGSVVRQHVRQHGIRIDVRGCLAELPILWRFALPAAGVSALKGPLTWLCNVMLVNAPHGMAEMGLVGAANNIRTLVLFLPGQIMQVFLPVMVNLAARRDTVGYQRALRANIVATAAVASAVALPVCLAPRLFMSFFGPGFAGHTAILVLMSAANVLRAVSDSVFTTLYARGQVWFALRLNLIWAAVILVSTYYLVQCRQLGALGYVTAYLVSNVPLLLLSLLCARRLMREFRESPSPPTGEEEADPTMPVGMGPEGPEAG